jgi:hypothetical protein
VRRSCLPLPLVSLSLSASVVVQCCASISASRLTTTHARYCSLRVAWYRARRRARTARLVASPARRRDSVSSAPQTRTRPLAPTRVSSAPPATSRPSGPPCVQC